MKKVMVFGTFDILHEGHKDFFRQARRYGDFLIVIIARDETVKIVKKMPSRNNEITRKKNITKSKLADHVLLGHKKDKYAVIRKYSPDMICLGYDQKAFVAGLRLKLKDMGSKAEIRRLKAYQPKIFKTSKLA